MTEQDAMEHAKVWHHAADELTKLVGQARASRDWQTLRPISTAACLARSVAEGYEQLSDGKIGT